MENPFTQKELIQIGVVLVAGGAFGTILKIAWDSYQGRIQPIRYEVFVAERSRISEGPNRLEAHFNIAGEPETRHFEKYYIVKIVLTNIMNAHIGEFNFGVTFSGEDIAFQVHSFSPDRHHSIKPSKPATLTSATNQIDFVCKPFNKKDTYVLKLFISVAPAQAGIGYLQLSSPLPVKFVDAQVESNSALWFGMREAKRRILHDVIPEDAEVRLSEND